MSHPFELDAGSWATLRQLLDEVLDLPAAARPAWLQALPPEHAALKPRLAALLSHADQAHPLSTLPRIETADFAGPRPDGHRAGDLVGPYRLVRLLGEGGMGCVWRAERDDMLRARTVALKLPRAGFAGATLLARQAREREILAALEHPNIARLYEAGVGADGQPYLALEYVEGEPIDRYCRTRGLDLTARLRLFLQVAGAVAHAHAQLVIHRDLKPANVLVTPAGDVKLLDFGIAKLIEPDTDAGTTLTEAGGRAMTPDYAAPEQILGGPLGTATDLYALGVMLYELLTDRRPYRLRLHALSRRAALEEAILAGEAPRPSAAVDDPRRARLLRGDLDTIVGKAMKRAPEERYRTVDALAADIARHLAHEPVLARPDRRGYRARKFVRRHRLGVAASAAVSLAIVSGAGVAVWQADRARAEQRRTEEVKTFITSIFRGADPYRGNGAALSAVELLEQARQRIDATLKDRPELRLEMQTLIGYSLNNLQAVKAAEALMREAVAQGRAALGDAHPLVLRARETHALTLRYAGDARASHQTLDALIPALRRAGDAFVPELVRALESRAVLAAAENRPRDAEAAAREMLAIGHARLGAGHPLTLDAMWALADALQQQGRLDEALALARTAYPRTLARHAGNAKAPPVIEAAALYGRLLARSGDLERGLPLLEDALAHARSVFGPTSVAVGYMAGNLARWQWDAGRLEPALATIETALAALAIAPGVESSAYAIALDRRALILLTARRPAAAAFDEAIARLERVRAADDPGLLTTRLDGVRALLREGRTEEARRRWDRLPATAQASTAPPAARVVLGTLLRHEGDAPGARRVHEAALAALGRGAEASRARTEALAELGLDLLALKDAAGAEAPLREALALARASRLAATPLYAEIATALARARLARGDGAGAEPLIAEARAFWRDFDPHHPEAQTDLSPAPRRLRTAAAR